MEFPRWILAIDVPEGSVAYSGIRQAVKAYDNLAKRYDELAERCVMDRTELSLEIANLRARLKAIDPNFSNP